MYSETEPAPQWLVEGYEKEKSVGPSRAIVSDRVKFKSFLIPCLYRLKKLAPSAIIPKWNFILCNSDLQMKDKRYFTSASSVAINFLSIHSTYPSLIICEKALLQCFSMRYISYRVLQYIPFSRHGAHVIAFVH